MGEGPIAGYIEAEQRRLDELLERASEQGGGGDLLRAALEQLGEALGCLHVAGEALRTTRAELEAAEEGLLSADEELRTINEQLRQRSNDATRAGQLLASVLADLEIGVVAVDRHLLVTMWNRKSEEMWGLQAETVVGLPLPCLDVGLPVAHLLDPLRRIIHDGLRRQEIGASAVTGRGVQMHISVVLTPLPGSAEQCQGVMLQVVG